MRPSAGERAIWLALDRIGTRADYPDDQPEEDDGYGDAPKKPEAHDGKHWTLQRSNETRAMWIDRLNHPPGESFKQWSARQMRQRQWLNRLDARCGQPRVERLVAFLGSDAPLAEKAEAVQRWCSWASDFFGPCLIPTAEYQYEFWFTGCDLSCLISHIYLRRSTEWAAYQRALAEAREGRRRARDRTTEHRERRAAAWLERHRSELLAVSPKPTLLVQARKRLDVLGVDVDLATYVAALKK
jgi:hypothetical protein